MTLDFSSELVFGCISEMILKIDDSMIFGNIIPTKTPKFMPGLGQKVNYLENFEISKSAQKI